MTLIVPWSKPYLDESDAKAAWQSIEDSWVSAGPANEKLESEISQYFNNTNFLLTSNGTTAIHLALVGLNLEKGSIIAVPSFSYLAAANIALQLGLKVEFYDVEYASLNILTSELSRLKSLGVSVLVIVSNYGNYPLMQEIVNWAKDNSVILFEDCAESLGTEVQGRLAGTFGDISILSFHATKTITTGEGGGVLTSNRSYYERMKLFRSHGVDHRRYFHELPGHNFRMTNFQAALGLNQLKKIDEIKDLRFQAYDYYKSCLKRIGFNDFQQVPKGVEPLFWAFALYLPENKNENFRHGIMEYLAQNGVETRTGFITPRQMEYFQSSALHANAEKASRNIFLPPFFTGISRREIDYVVGLLDQFQEQSDFD